MKRDMIETLDREMDKIDKYLVDVGRKWSSFMYRGQEYFSYEREEKEHYLSGEPYWKGAAFCPDEITIEEPWDDIETVEQMDIRLTNFVYERNEDGEVTFVERDGFYY